MLRRLPPRTSPARTSVLRPSRAAVRAAVSPAIPPPAMTTSYSLAVGKARLAGAQYLVGIAPPPVELREDLHFLEPDVAGVFDPSPYPGQIDHAVAHHAAVVEEVPSGDQPVADVIGEHPFLCGAADLLLELRIPPHVVDVHGNADAIAERIADVERLFKRVDARALRGLHGVQRLDGERNARLARFGKNC